MSVFCRKRWPWEDQTEPSGCSPQRHVEPASPRMIHICALSSRAAERHLFFFFLRFLSLMTRRLVPGCGSGCLQWLDWEHIRSQRNNQAVTHAALSALLGRRTGWPKSWGEMTDRWALEGVIRSFSADKQTLSQSPRSRARALLYASREQGDICAIIYSQEICWEAQGLLKEGIIRESKDQRLSSQDISMQKRPIAQHVTIVKKKPQDCLERWIPGGLRKEFNSSQGPKYDKFSRACLINELQSLVVERPGCVCHKRNTLSNIWYSLVNFEEKICFHPGIPEIAPSSSNVLKWSSNFNEFSCFSVLISTVISVKSKRKFCRHSMKRNLFGDRVAF